MLMTIDILLGLSVVMLLASMAVTVMSQFVTSVINSRGRHLLHGLADLLQQIDPEIERAIAKKIAGTILMHPLIRDSLGRYGTTIHREELTRLLMDLASGNITKALFERLGPNAQYALMTLLEKNGIAKPAEILDKVRLKALELELSSPGLAGNVRQNLALLQEAHCDLIAKINMWFDQTIDRVSGRFTLTTRVITVACSLLVACTLQLDTLELINRLSIDTELRNTLVQKAVDIGEQIEKTPDTLSKLSGQNRDDIRQLVQLGIISIPKSTTEWNANWHKVNPFGIAFSVVLVSLGAPFWYNALKSLIRLRSAVADKDDQQREQRQNIPAVLAGEGTSIVSQGEAQAPGGKG